MPVPYFLVGLVAVSMWLCILNLLYIAIRDREGWRQIVRLVLAAIAGLGLVQWVLWQGFHA